MSGDAWLSRWLQRMREHAHRNVVLELGCGGGRDTSEILAAGMEVVAMDLSAESLARCAVVAPVARLVRADIGRPLPFRDGEFDVVLASLSLHYFPWDVTVKSMDEIARCIGSGGLFVMRVNSANDLNYGADSTDEIERHFLRVGSQTKRFFDRDDLERLMRGWIVESMEEMIIHRYEKPKAIWEVVAEKDSPAP
ncbi:MAG: class I SAM-dependent methyltransferase [Candidatus Hydrogenedentes bacterium]|nr:class I SAM-dependent methyltransferase [Candidatus Hydrogenedentota bacterium]